MSKKYAPKRRYEAVDPKPVTLPVAFQRPPSLAEQVARYMADHNRYAAAHELESREEEDDIDIEDNEFYSPHELVFDQDLNREIPRYQKEALDSDRREFTRIIEEKVKADKAAKLTALKAEQMRRAAEKKAEKTAPKNESPDGDEE